MKVLLPLLLVLLVGTGNAGGMEARPLADSAAEQDFADYRTSLKQEIHRRLFRARYVSVSGGIAVVAFKLERSGVITRSFLTRSSGDPHVDRAAMAVLREGTQFPPFPARLRAPWLEISVPLHLPRN